ncbi:hypothetical protein ThvES_00004030 [Thiovulum sp. ES]|nr:hypothetical protein ThvES_00004030 [Thiovulum sp. ES]
MVTEITEEYCDFLKVRKEYGFFKSLNDFEVLNFFDKINISN